jgi:hypothetical protein
MPLGPPPPVPPVYGGFLDAPGGPAYGAPYPAPHVVRIDPNVARTMNRFILVVVLGVLLFLLLSVAAVLAVFLGAR